MEDDARLLLLLLLLSSRLCIEGFFEWRGLADFLMFEEFLPEEVLIVVIIVIVVCGLFSQDFVSGFGDRYEFGLEA